MACRKPKHVAGFILQKHNNYLKKFGRKVKVAVVRLILGRILAFFWEGVIKRKSK